MVFNVHFVAPNRRGQQGVVWFHLADFNIPATIVLEAAPTVATFRGLYTRSAEALEGGEGRRDGGREGEIERVCVLSQTIRVMTYCHGYYSEVGS